MSVLVDKTANERGPEMLGSTLATLATTLATKINSSACSPVNTGLDTSNTRNTSNFNLRIENGKKSTKIIRTITSTGAQ
jgi:hypothetical protein